MDFLIKEFADIVDAMRFEATVDTTPQAPPTILSFETKEEAEVAWTDMLRTAGVDPTWSWEKCVRTCSSNPLYRALKTTAERKEVFAIYCREEKHDRETQLVQRHKREETQLMKLFQDRKLSTAVRYKSADMLFANEQVWRDAMPNTRRNVFYLYLDQLKTRERTESRLMRSANIATIEKLLVILEINHLSAWRDVLPMLKSHVLFASNPQISNMDPIDILNTFETHVLNIDAEHTRTRRSRASIERRNERKARDGYRALLSELVESKLITKDTQWKSIYPIVCNDSRFIIMLSTPGSDPLELMWNLQMSIKERFKSVCKTIMHKMAVSMHFNVVNELPNHIINQIL